MSRTVRLSFGVFALLAGGALLASCGGGGGGGGLSTSTPTPTPTSAAPTFVPSGCTATTYSPNYILSNSYTSGQDSNNGNSGFTYWRHFPISVYIPANAPASTVAATLAGYNEWQNATGKTLYTRTTNQATADLVVSYLPDNQPADAQGDITVGLTTISYANDNHILTVAEQGSNPSRNTMQLFVLTPSGSANTASDNDGTTQSIAAHEFGHALGIGPHSLAGPNYTSGYPGDLMYYLLHNTPPLPEDVTQRDLNTLLTVYCGNFPTGSALMRQTPFSGKVNTRTFPPLRRPNS